MKSIGAAGNSRPISGTQTCFWPLTGGPHAGQQGTPHVRMRRCSAVRFSYTHRQPNGACCWCNLSTGPSAAPSLRRALSEPPAYVLLYAGVVTFRRALVSLAIERRWSSASAITPGTLSVHCHEYGAGGAATDRPNIVRIGAAGAVTDCPWQCTYGSTPAFRLCRSALVYPLPPRPRNTSPDACHSHPCGNPRPPMPS